MIEECECPPCEEGLPPWLSTFADLMTLLMCFFVLLLSFAEMDALKYRQVAGAMKNAFGVQRDIKAIEIPKGTNVVAQQYSPGKPVEVTPLEIMREKTTDDSKTNLDFSDTSSKNDRSLGETEAEAIVQAKAALEAQELAKELKAELAAAIGDGLLDVEAFADRVLIRIREKGSFGSGQATLKKDFFPILKLIADVLKQRDGLFIITGHTDDIPIKTRRFRSNWDLSATRATNVVHYFIQYGNIDPERMEIRALADNEPIVPNDSWGNRAQNRRVEISVLHGNRLPIDFDAPSESVDFVSDTDS
ncbi:MAG: chemotaxis protein MotB [Rubritalea sp.]|jgi:chemotaxis protein MotB